MTEYKKREKENLVERDYKIASGLIKQTPVSWPQAVREARAKTNEQLERSEQTPAVLQVLKEREAE